MKALSPKNWAWAFLLTIAFLCLLGITAHAQQEFPYGNPTAQFHNKGWMVSDSGLKLPYRLTTSPYWLKQGQIAYNVSDSGVYYNTGNQWVRLTTSLASGVTALTQGYGIINTPSTIVSTGTQKVDTGTLFPAVRATIPPGGSGTVTNIATASPITGGPITTTGTIGLDETVNYTWSGVHTFSNTSGVLVLQNSVSPLSGLTNVLSDYENSVNGFVQHVIRNQSSGNNASADYIVNNNISTNTSHYFDFGKNSSGYTQTGVNDIVGGNGSYIYDSDDSVVVGAANSSLTLFTGGLLRANARMVISSSGSIWFPGLSTGVAHLSSAGLVSSSTIATADIASNAVTYAKMQSESASTLLGNPTGGGAVPSEITLGSGLSFAGTTLVATGSGGTVTTVTANALSPLFTSTTASPTSTPVISFSLSNAAAHTFFGNFTGSSGAPSYSFPVLASADFANQGTATTLLHGNASGNPSWSQVQTADVANSAITYAKIQTETASTLLGNPTTVNAAPAEITLGAGLSFSAGTLIATGSGGTVTNIATTSPITGGPITSTGTIGLDETVDYTWSGVHTFTNTNGILVLQNGVSELSGITNVLSDYEASSNNFAQSLIRNQSAGANASTDYIVNNDISTNTAHYFDIGKNSSGYSQPGTNDIVSASGSYIYDSDDSVAIGAASKSLTLFTGGLLRANARLVISSSGSLWYNPFSTGVLQSTSAGLITSSTALANGTTSTTQSANDNTTKNATDAYVDQYVPNYSTATTTTTLTPTVAITDRRTPVYANLTAQATTLVIANPSGTFADMQVIELRLYDNGTSRALTWGGNYNAGNGTLPTSTTTGKDIYIEFQYNSRSAKYDCVAGCGATTW